MQPEGKIMVELSQTKKELQNLVEFRDMRYQNSGWNYDREIILSHGINLLETKRRVLLWVLEELKEGEK